MTLKKLFAGLFSLAAVLFAVCAITVCAGAETSGDFEYSVLDDGTVQITDYTGDATNLTIPSAIDGRTVTTIGYAAFEDCTTLKSVTISEGLTFIGSNAFKNCSNLTSITIPDSVTTIEQFSFMDCSSLSSFIIPDSVTYVGWDVFSGTPLLNDQKTSVQYVGKWVVDCDENITSAEIKDGTVGISGYAFYRCSDLSTISLPDSLRYIGWNAFRSCSRLTSIKIPYGVTEILDNTFNGCIKLTSVSIPNTLKSIGGSAFDGCSSLASITIPDSVEYVHTSAFYGTPFLNNQTTTLKYAGKCVIDCDDDVTTVTIKSGTVGLGDYAFDDCKNLTSIKIPNGVKVIGSGAFSFCTSLSSVTIPDSVTYIGLESFCRCDNLKDVYYTSSKEQWDKIDIEIYNYFFGNDTLLNATIHYNYNPNAPSSVTGLKLKGRAGDALRISWTKNTSADGYIIEMKNGSTWTRVGKITKNSTVEFRKDKLKAGTAYTFRVKAYKMDGKTALYSGYTSISARTNPSAVSGLKLKGRSGDALRLSWTKNTSADGYIIEMKSGSTWTRVGKITKNSTVEFRKAGLKAGTAYSFRVKAYKMSGKTALYSGYTTISARTNPSAVSGLKLKNANSNAVRLAWAKNTSADGYIIEMKVNGTWTRVGKVTKNSTVEFRKGSLKSKTSYTFRIKAYKMSGKTALYSGYTTITVKTK